MARHRESYADRISRLMAQGFTHQQAAGKAPKELQVSTIRQQAKQQNITIKQATDKAKLRLQRRPNILKGGIQKRTVKFENGNTHRSYRIPVLALYQPYITAYRGKAYGVYIVISYVTRNKQNKREVLHYQTNTVFLRGVPTEDVATELAEEIDELINRYDIIYEGTLRTELVFITGKTR